MTDFRTLQNLVNSDPSVRDQLFRYHYKNNYFGNANEYDARINFEQVMRTPQHEILINSYLPIYNRTSSSDDYRKRSFTVATTISGVGLVAILLGASGDNNFSKGLEKVGVAATFAGVVGLGLASIKDRYFRQ